MTALGKCLFLSLVLAAPAFADPACEKKLNDTKMMFHPKDAQIMCDENLTVAAQDCIVEVITKTKGKLKNIDLFEVYGICRVDAGAKMRQCMIKNLDKPYNDPGYKGAKKVGDICMRERLEAAMADAKAGKKTVRQK
jgi:hypothetical protein